MWTWLTNIGIWIWGRRKKKEKLKKIVDQALSDLGFEPHPEKRIKLPPEKIREIARYARSLTEEFSEKEIIAEVISRGYYSEFEGKFPMWVVAIPVVIYLISRRK